MADARPLAGWNELFDRLLREQRRVVLEALHTLIGGREVAALVERRIVIRRLQRQFDRRQK